MQGFVTRIFLLLLLFSEYMLLSNWIKISMNATITQTINT